MPVINRRKGANTTNYFTRQNIYNTVYIFITRFYVQHKKVFRKNLFEKVMNKRNSSGFIIAIIIIFLTSFASLNGQWLQSGGPYGGYVKQLVFNTSNDAFIATNGGVLIKASTSPSWSYVNDGLTTNDIRALATIGSNLFAGGYEVAGSPGGVFLSTNKGLNWTVRNTGLTNRTITALGVNGVNLFAGTNGAGVYVSSNNGLTWTQVNNGLSGLSLIINNFYSSGGTIFAGTREGLAVSTNNGQNWTVYLSGLPNEFSKRITAITIKGSNLYIGTGSGIFLSTDNGANFSSAQGDLGFTSINSLNNDGTVLIAGCQNGGVFKSTNDGTNWTAFNTGLTNLYVNSINFIANYVYVGTQGGGVFYSLNNSNWVNTIEGMYNTSPKSFDIKGTNLYLGTLLNGVYFTSNNGTTWTPTNAGINTSIINDLINDGTNFYAATSTGVFKSTNNGNSWLNIGSSFGSTSYVLSVLKSGNMIYAGTFGAGIYVSTNEGTNWTAINSGLVNLTIWEMISDGTSIYAATEIAGIFKTSAGGTTWTVSNGGITGSTDLRAISISGGTIFTGFSGLYKSTDGASTWTSILNDGLAGKVIRTIYSYDNGNIVLAGTVNNGLYFSTNGGANFYAANTGLPSIVEINSISIINGTVFIGTTGFGVWRRPLEEIISGINNISTEVPSDYSLYQNYPNPFNPSTKIKFAIKNSGFVSLKVFDIMGREIYTLYNGILKPGLYETDFKAEELNSGVYFYRLQGEDFLMTKRMMLLK